MRHRIAAAVLAASLLGVSGSALASTPQGCDPPCREGFMCREGVCVSACNPPCPGEYVCRENRCVPLAAAAAPPAGPDPLAGIRFFAGLAAGPGFSGFWPEHQLQIQFRAAGHFALRAGVLLNRLEVGLELAPATFYAGDYADAMIGAGSKLNLNLTIGYLAKITERVHWPLRFGGGVMTVDTATTFGLLRFDLLGFGWSFPVGRGQLLLELAAPSLRFFSELEHLGIWSWLFNLSAVYVL